MICLRYGKSCDMYACAIVILRFAVARKGGMKGMLGSSSVGLCRRVGATV